MCKSDTASRRAFSELTFSLCEIQDERRRKGREGFLRGVAFSDTFIIRHSKYSSCSMLEARAGKVRERSFSRENVSATETRNAQDRESA